MLDRPYLDGLSGLSLLQARDRDHLRKKAISSFVLYGADYSVYTRIPRLILEEANADYRLEPVDIFAPEGPPAGYLDRHPFHKIPVLEHDGFEVYETDAIADYIVAATGVGLVPDGARARARMRQIMRIMDNYGYPVLTWEIYVREYLRGATIEAETISAAERILHVVEGMVVGPMMTGDDLSLADCWTVPIVEYLLFAPTGRALLDAHHRLSDWWSLVSMRPSVVATRFADERRAKTL